MGNKAHKSYVRQLEESLEATLEHLVRTERRTQDAMELLRLARVPLVHSEHPEAKTLVEKITAAVEAYGCD